MLEAPEETKKTNNNNKLLNVSGEQITCKKATASMQTHPHIRPLFYPYFKCFTFYHSFTLLVMVHNHGAHTMIMNYNLSKLFSGKKKLKRKQKRNESEITSFS